MSLCVDWLQLILSHCAGGGVMAGAALQSFVAATASNFISHSEEVDEDGKVGVAVGGEVGVVLTFGGVRFIVSCIVCDCNVELAFASFLYPWVSIPFHADSIPF